MGLVSIGPVVVSHGDPSFSHDSSATGHGIDLVTISGSCSWNNRKTLRGLVRNPDARVTKHGHTGVQEYLIFDDELLSDWTGYYILENFSSDADQQHSLAGVNGDVPFSLSAAFLGDVE